MTAIGARQGPPAPVASRLHWVELTVDERRSRPTLVADIDARRVDGMTVHGVLSPDEASRAVEGLQRHHDRRIPSMFGTMLGRPLAELARLGGPPGELGPYLDDAERAREMYVDAFGFDPHDRVAEALRPLAGGLAVGDPRLGERRYSSGNVRWYEPGHWHLAAHVGNEFEAHTDVTSAHLRTTTRTLDHFSWFVILQAPEVGGALSVYDLLYETRTPAAGEYGVRGRDDADFDVRPALRIAPPAGSLVFFGGGWRWHRVDPVGGARPRITYGGFAGPRHDGTGYDLWF